MDEVHWRCISKFDGDGDDDDDDVCKQLKRRKDLFWLTVSDT